MSVVFKITQLNFDVERVKVDHQRLEQELDFILGQQNELEDMLRPLEQALDQLPPITHQQHADLEREHMWEFIRSLQIHWFKIHCFILTYFFFHVFFCYLHVVSYNTFLVYSVQIWKYGGGIQLLLKRLLDSSVSSLIRIWLMSERTSGHQKLIPTFPWIDNCLMVRPPSRIFRPRYSD